MKAIQMSETGGPDVLRLVELPTPQPQPGQVLVRATAAGVNFGETQMRQGTYPLPTLLPTIPGSEVVGKVVAVGEDVDASYIGVRVAAMLPGAGGYAEYAVAEAARVIPLPESVSDGAALGILAQGLTAYYLLRHAAPIPAGGSALVQAAAGGVGSLLVQLARQEGAGLIIGTASTDQKRALVRELGADVAVDYSAPDWVDQTRDATNGREIDVIFESVGEKISADSFGLLAPFGRLVTYGALGG